MCDIRRGLFICFLAQFREVCGGVWRQSDRVCSERSRKHAASLPPTLCVLTKGKPFSRSDGAKRLWGSPFLCSIHPSRSVFTPFPLPFTRLCCSEEDCVRTAPLFLQNWKLELETIPFQNCVLGQHEHVARKGKKEKCRGELMKAMGHTLSTKWKRKSNGSPLSDPREAVFR